MIATGRFRIREHVDLYAAPAASGVRLSCGVVDVQEIVGTAEILRSEHKCIAPWVPRGRIRNAAFDLWVNVP